MKTLNTFLFISILPIFLYSQTIEFTCDSKSEFYTKNWADEKINIIYDSLNHINFNQIDFELRMWNDGYGQAFLTYDVLILRHYIKENNWKSFYYSGFKKGNKHKTIQEYFDNPEITYYNQENTCAFFDTLVQNHLLTITPPNPDTFSNQLIISHDSYYIFELIQKNCKKTYTLSQGVGSSFPNITAFKQMSKLIKYRNMWLNQTWIPK